MATGPAHIIITTPEDAEQCFRAFVDVWVHTTAVIDAFACALATTPPEDTPCERCIQPFTEGEQPVQVREHPKQAAPTKVHEGCIRETNQPWEWQYQPFKARERGA
jgi:hypothetical protein